MPDEPVNVLTNQEKKLVEALRDSDLRNVVITASDLTNAAAAIDAATTIPQLRTILKKLAAATCRLAVEMLRRDALR